MTVGIPEFMRSHPEALEVYLYYKREKPKSAMSKRISMIIGENDYKKECDKVKNMTQREIRQLVGKNPANIRLCILSDVIDKKSILQSAFNITKMIGTQDIDCQDFEFWHTRFSSGSRNSDRKTFSDLPIEVLGKIVEQLDFPSQMRLRKVSHGLRNIVDQTRPSIDSFSFVLESNNDSETVARITVHRKNHVLLVYKHHHHPNKFSERLFNGIKILLNNPRLQLNHFEWINYLSSEMDEKFIEMINSLNQKIEIEFLDATLNGNSMIDLLKAVKPEILEIIKFGGERIHIDQLAQLEQWKKAKIVIFNAAVYDFSRCIHHFQHFERVWACVKSLSMDDLLLLKNISIQNEKLNYFIIYAGVKPSETEIEKTLGLSDIHFDEKAQCFSGRYDIPESNDYLKFLADEHRVDFVRRKLIEEDYFL